MCVSIVASTARSLPTSFTAATSLSLSLTLCAYLLSCRNLLRRVVRIHERRINRVDWCIIIRICVRCHRPSEQQHRQCEYHRCLLHHARSVSYLCLRSALLCFRKILNSVCR